jgi:hydroxylaminobenzene mutase
LAALLGTAALSPITAVGHEAEPWKEAMITAGFVFIGLAIILAVVLLMLGLRSTAEPQ